eukprot:jgi/Undpi1/3811/HiC_scaffold_16.g07180.m1
MTDTYPDVMDFCAQADDRPTERHPEGIDEVDGAPVCAEQGAAPAQAATAAAAAATVAASEVRLVAYEDERQLDDIMSLVDRDLSEPYSIFTYRYFLHNWPGLCFVAKAGERTVGSIVCKAERELEDDPYTGYIAMLAVDTAFRKHGIGTSLALKAIEAMRDLGCEEVVLETEVTNGGALNLYTKLGFSKNERLIKYYLNGVDAFRLKLWFR